jgi:hypothetical protein
MGVAEKTDLSVYPSDPVEALERSLRIAQAYLDQIDATGDLRLKLIALERVAAISTTMTKLQLRRSKDLNKELAEQMAWQLAAETVGSVVACARHAVYVAADGNSAAAERALAEFGADVERIRSQQAAA